MGEPTDTDTSEDGSEAAVVGGREWGPDHPCFNGHMVVSDPTECDRCGAELERNPIGRWRSIEDYDR